MNDDFKDLKYTTLIVSLCLIPLLCMIVWLLLLKPSAAYDTTQETGYGNENVNTNTAVSNDQTNPYGNDDISESSQPIQYEPSSDSQTSDMTGEMMETDPELDDALSEFEAIGSVEVDKGIFDVSITIPMDYIGETTQSELDAVAEEKGYRSATLNNDGSVTYVMTKTQHKEMLEVVSDSIYDTLSEMIGSPEYPNITDIEANADFTNFTVVTTNTEPDISESLGVLALYTYGGMYGIYSGEHVDNVHVDFVNADSGEIIASANSSELGE